MTNDEKLLQQALDALDSMNGTQFLCDAAHHPKKDRHEIGQRCPVAERYKATREAIRARLSQPEPEPVAWRYRIIPPSWTYSEEKPNREFAGSAWDRWQVQPLYTAPPQHEWQGLTEYEVGFLTVFDGLHDIEVPLLADFIRHIEVKLKEKNS